MRAGFMSLDFESRYEVIKNVTSIIHRELSSISSSLGIMTYGSSTYGYNNLVRGNMDDIDAFMTVPMNMSFCDYVGVVDSVFPGANIFPESHYQRLMDRKYGILRFYSELQGVRIGFRVITTRSLARITSQDQCSHCLTNVAIVGSSRIIQDVETRLGGGDTRNVVLESYPFYEKSTAYLAVQQYTISPCMKYLGALGRKFLTCQELYDPTGAIKRSLSSMWRTYIRLSLSNNPAVTADTIVNQIMRSERFSDKFRDDLIEKIRFMNNQCID